MLDIMTFDISNPLLCVHALFRAPYVRVFLPTCAMPFLQLVDEADEAFHPGV